MADIIKMRRDTAANWTTANPILADGELGFETNTKWYKMGDGVTHWNDLDYGHVEEYKNIAEHLNLLTMTGTEVTGTSATQLKAPSDYKSGDIFYINEGADGMNYSEFVDEIHYYIAKKDGSLGDALNNATLFDNTYSSTEAVRLSTLYNAEIGSGDGVYDISAAYPSASPFASLQAALTAFTDSTQKGGMSIKYIDSNTGEYVQYRLKSATFSTNEEDWEEITSRVLEDAILPVENSGRWIDNNGDWNNPTGSNVCRYYLIPVTEGDEFVISHDGGSSVHYAWLTDDSTSGEASFVGDTGRTTLIGSADIKAPNGANYLYILSYYASQRLGSLKKVINVFDKIEEECGGIANGIRDYIAFGFRVEQGMFNTSDGYTSQINTKRAVLVDFIPKGGIVTCKEGYYIRGLYRYVHQDGKFVFHDFQNMVLRGIDPLYSSWKNTSDYYVRPIIGKYYAATEDVVLEDAIESVNIESGFHNRTPLAIDVEVGQYTAADINEPLIKQASDNRMRTFGIYKNTGTVSVKCKDGYECNIMFCADNDTKESGKKLDSYFLHWSKSHIHVKGELDNFVVLFRRDDNDDVTDSDLDCVEYFEFDNELDTKLPAKAARPRSGYEDFEVTCNTFIADTVNTELSLQDEEVLGTDKCRIYLPNTYSMGKPTRLIIHCHGASVNYNQNNFSNLGVNDKIWKYWVAKGYAILLVSGMAGESELQIGTTSGSPLAYQCHVKAYRYVIDKYNICNDGCFVVGISAGSIPALQISNFTDIPVLAQIIYCGIYSVPRAFMLLGGYSNYSTPMKEYIAEQYGFQGEVEWSVTDPVSDDEFKYIYDNAMKFAGWNTYLRGATTKMTQEDYADFIGAYYGSNLPIWIDAQNIRFDSIEQLLLSIKVKQKNTQSPVGDTKTAVDAEKELYDTISLNRNVPLKVFHSTDDPTAPYRYAKYYYDMLKRGGSQVEFRTFPTGGHSPYGADRTEIVNGASVDTCVMAVESLLFMQRFE